MHKILFHHLRSLINNPRSSLIQFAIGSVTFLLGVSAIMVAEHYMSSSIKQEIFTLFGALIALIGFLLGLSGYFCFIISRFKNL